MACTRATKELSSTLLRGWARNCVALAPFKPPTLDDHIFLVRTPIRTFLDFMERSLSLESDHLLVDGI